MSDATRISLASLWFVIEASAKTSPRWITSFPDEAFSGPDAEANAKAEAARRNAEWATKTTRQLFHQPPPKFEAMDYETLWYEILESIRSETIEHI